MKNHIILAALAAAVLAACGGGGNDGENKSSATAVKVVGASLADSGAFGGAKFTVQPGVAGTSYPVYTQRIAATYGVPLCNTYTVTNANGTTANVNAGCTNYAVAGAKVHVNSGTVAVDTVPVSGIRQLVDAGNVGYAAGDLLIVGELSANDTATLVEAFLTAAAGKPASLQELLASLLTPAQLTSTTDTTVLGAIYMQDVADKLTTAVKTNAIDKGAKRIAILNTLDVSRTPKLQGALAQIAAGPGGTAQATQVQALVRGWIKAYNDKLEANVAALNQLGTSSVIVVDFFTNFNNEMNDPPQYGLSNVTATVCDQIVTKGLAPAVTALSTPSTMAACTDVAASALTPTVGADGTNMWWKKFLFADNFHPTPYGHQLLAQMVAKRLTEAGWL